MAQFGFTTADSLPAQQLTTAQIRASILARDAASREDSQTVIAASGVVSVETGHVLPITNKKVMQHIAVFVYEDGTAYTYDGTRDGAKKTTYTELLGKYDFLTIDALFH